MNFSFGANESRKNKTLIYKNRARNWIWAIFRAVLIIGLSFLIIYPILIRFSLSLKSYSDYLDPTVFFIPKSPSFLNYRIAFNAINFSSAALYTGLFSALLSILQTASCTLVAYSFARFDYWGKKLLFGLVILTLAIPPQIILLPLYIRFNYFSLASIFQVGGTMSGISLINTWWPFLMLSVTANGFKNGLYIYILRQYFTNVPNVLEEAAYIDGCNIFKTFYKIMLPGAMPMLITVFLFSFVWQWNDYYYTVILAPNLPTLTMNIYGLTSTLLGGAGSYWQEIVKAPQTLMMMVPLIILYIFTQRYFVESIEKSGIVG